MALPALAAAQNRESASAVAALYARANAPLTRLPARIPAQGPTALHIQILLDRAHFSPGIIDGAWGNNAARALAFYADPGGNARLLGRTPQGLATVDKSIYERLRRAAGEKPLLRRYVITQADVAGPFTAIPSKVYDQAKLKCLC